MRHDFMLGQVQVELQGHQDGKLEGYQLSAVHSELLLQFLWEFGQKALKTHSHENGAFVVLKMFLWHFLDDGGHT